MVEWNRMAGVVYFDQQMGALHVVCWLKSFVFLRKNVFLLCLAVFYIYDGKRWKKLFWCKKNDFDQQTACGAPLWWSKYTTGRCTALKFFGF